jgi:hypothetical protein
MTGTHYEVKDADGNMISTRGSIQFARSDANKHEGATITQVVPTYAEGRKVFTYRFNAD